jgi:hypothetical protein
MGFCNRSNQESESMSRPPSARKHSIGLLRLLGGELQDGVRLGLERWKVDLHPVRTIFREFEPMISLPCLKVLATALLCVADPVKARSTIRFRIVDLCSRLNGHRWNDGWRERGNATMPAPATTSLKRLDDLLAWRNPGSARRSGRAASRLQAHLSFSPDCATIDVGHAPIVNGLWNCDGWSA